MNEELNLDPVTAAVLGNLKELCVPTENKIEYLLERYQRFGALYQEYVPKVTNSSPLIEQELLFDEFEYEKDEQYFSSAGLVNKGYDAGVVIPSKEKAKLLVISHIDLVSNFEIGFRRGQTFRLEEFMDGTYLVRGALDNGITNAFLCTLLDNLEKLPSDVEILFSLGEESGCTGVTEFLSHKPPEYFEDLFVLNLDVTNEGFGAIAGSVEFDYADPEMCAVMDISMEGLGFTTDRFCDDTSAVLEFTQAAMSYCIPTDEYCHTYNSCALTEFFPQYYEGLKHFVCHFEFDYSYERAEAYYKECIIEEEKARAKGRFNKPVTTFTK